MSESDVNPPEYIVLYDNEWRVVIHSGFKRTAFVGHICNNTSGLNYVWNTCIMDPKHYLNNVVCLNCHSHISEELALRVKLVCVL